MQEDLTLLEVTPDHITLVPISKPYCSILEEVAKEEDESLAVCRVIIQDKTDHGVTLPARLVDDGKHVSFILPEQLCIFNPKQTYILKVEVLLETQLLTPALASCKINLEGLIEPEEDLDEQTSEEKTEATNEAPDAFDDDSALDAVLEAVAPIPRQQLKKTKVEDIVKQLDEEFVKNALWKSSTQTTPQPKMQMAPMPVMRAPEPPSLSPEQLAIKQKMKNLLRNMLS